MSNQLEIIIKESELDQSKAKFILDNFQNYFEVADEWSNKAKNIVVKDACQKADMEMARVGRLFLREKRIAVENARKKLKEQALREGKAIDGIANVLKALIIPIEEYLEKQEKFVEIQEENKREIIRIEVERKIEEERIAKEKAEVEERERIKQENERLKKEAEAKLAEERRIAEDKFKEEQKKALAEVERVHKLNEEKLSKEKAERENDRMERERLEKELRSQIECPHCHKKFSLK